MRTPLLSGSAGALEVTSQNWVIDVAKIAPNKRTWHDWWCLGQHHAHATIAWSLRQYGVTGRQRLFAAIVAGAIVESKRLKLAPECAYWLALQAELELEVTSNRAPWSSFRPKLVVDNAKRQAA